MEDLETTRDSATIKDFVAMKAPAVIEGPAVAIEAPATKIGDSP